MEIESRSVEGPIIVVPISGLEVTGGVKSGGVPKPTSEVSEQGKVRPKLRNLPNKDGVFIYGA